MIIYIIAVAEALFYLLAVPVNLVVRLDGLRTGTGISAFDVNAARRQATEAIRGRGGKGDSHPDFGDVWPVLRRLRFERIELTGRISMGDAAATALICGALNGMGRCLGNRADALRVDVSPVFSDQLRLELRGMIRARAGQIIIAVYRSRKGRIFPWTSIPSRAS